MKHLIRLIIWSVIALYAIIFFVPKIPGVQEYIGEKTQELLARKLGTKVQIGSIDVRFPNRIVIDDVAIYDQAQKEMLKAGRMAATIDILPLFESKYSISALQLFGTKINIYHKADSTLNCQFAIDSLKSKEPSETPLDLHITKIIIRNSTMKYDSIGFSKLSSNIALNQLTNEKLDITVKRTTFVENSGVIVREFHGSVKADLSKSKFYIPSIRLKLPSSEILIDEAHIKKNNKDIDFDGLINFNSLSCSDFIPVFSKYNIKVPETLKALKLDGKISVVRKSNELSATLNINSKNTEEVIISASAEHKDNNYDFLISRLHINDNILTAINNITRLPDAIMHLGTLDAKGRFVAEGDVTHPKMFSLNADAQASKIGQLGIDALYNKNKLDITVKTPGLKLAKITNSSLEKVVCDIKASADLTNKDNIYDIQRVNIDGNVEEVIYEGRAYNNIALKGNFNRGNANGTLAINDSKAKTDIDFDAIINQNRFTVHVPDKDTNKKWQYLGGTPEIKELNADITNTHFVMKNGKEVNVDNIHISKTTPARDSSVISVNTDFAQVELSGKIDLATLPYSIANIVAKNIPSAPGLPKITKTDNNYSIRAHIADLHTIKQFVEIPLEITKPIDISGYVNDVEERLNIGVDAPVLTYKNMEFTGTNITIWTPEKGVKAAIETLLKTNNGKVSLNSIVNADDDKMLIDFAWDNLRKNIFRGKISFLTQFSPALGGGNVVEANIPISHFEVGDTIWTITSKGIEYHNDKLIVNNLFVGSENQNININGIASENANDSMVVNLHNVDVEYILDLVDFEPNDFQGRASGTAMAYGMFNDLMANVHLDVADFRYKGGTFGTLHADAKYSNLSQMIDIDAICQDVGQRHTKVDGFVSPQNNSIDLNIKAHDTNLDLLKDFCSSFMDDINLKGNGNVRLHGPFNNLNLTGQIVADGSFFLKPCGAKYTMPGDTVTLKENMISFDGMPIIDKDGNTARLYGGLPHDHLRRIKYDMQARTDRFLIYDYPELYSPSNPQASSLYCGVAYINGTIDIDGQDNDVNITGDVDIQKGSFITYNSSSPNAITSKDFISWHSANKKEEKNEEDEETSIQLPKVTGNLRMSFLATVPKDMKLHIIMDAITGDYIDFYGDGNLRISYYNKGSFEIFGNYHINNGNYSMTIQNLLKRNFEFRNGSVINFGGAPYMANINLEAMYHLNSVPLSDLGVGSSFKTNNVPVNCLMNITGTPEKPLVTFSLDLPSLSTDAKQMVSSLINSDETMNQQVLYLLAIGRFYSQSTAGNVGNVSNTTTTGTSQTTLAMQSFLSGTLSQQLNEIINGVVKTNNWSVGANVTPGTDGFSNAEYEGLLSGRLFNNRLIFNGQFGYRDNIYKNTQNFIGDFSLQYLLTPNGNISLKVYNQSNDRYFTRSSLNTQGIGVVFQKEFGK